MLSDHDLAFEIRIASQITSTLTYRLVVMLQQTLF